MKVFVIILISLITGCSQGEISYREPVKLVEGSPSQKDTTDNESMDKDFSSSQQADSDDNSADAKASQLTDKEPENSKDDDSEEQDQPVNKSPVWETTGTAEVDFGKPLNLALLATDEDDDPITYSCSECPANMTVNQSSLNWVADSKDPTVTATISASDGKDSADLKLTITVQPEVTHAVVAWGYAKDLKIIKFGFTAGKATEDDARTEAMNLCSLDECSVLEQSNEACVAIGHNFNIRKTTSTVVSGKGSTRDKAREDARLQCADCNIVDSVCGPEIGKSFLYKVTG